MSNPVVALQTLRQAYIDGTPVQLQDGYYLIGDQKFPENTKTIFKRSLKGGLFILFSMLPSHRLLF